MSILSVQSWVAYGHVGNAAALFALQRLGLEVCAINTTQFSNHPGYGAHAGRVTGGAAVAELVHGLAACGVLAGLDAVLSGYLGDAGTLDAVLDAVARARALRPDLRFLCDPVLGDRVPGRYVAEDLASGLRDRAVREADILTPNLFELGFLLGEPAAADAPDPARLARDAARLRGRMRPGGILLVSSVRTGLTAPDRVGCFLCTPCGDHLVETPLLPIEFSGSGDLLAALFLARLLRGDPPPAAMEHAVNAVWAVLERTVRDGRRELAIVAAQALLAEPGRRFRVAPAVG